MVTNFIKIAFRNFWQRKIITLINITGLSVGISAALTIFLIVRFDLTFDNFHQDGDRIYRVVTNFTFSGVPSFNRGVCGALPEAVKTQVTGVELSAPFYTLYQIDVAIPHVEGASAFRKQNNVILADERYFKLFSYRWLVGSPETSLKAPGEVVLTTDRAHLYFPSVTYSQILGRAIY